jgi:[ribosomal protein S5]-alanine N-acetyltransferase
MRLTRQQLGQWIPPCDVDMGAAMNLTTARLRLRDFRPDDWPVAPAYQSDPRYLRYYAWTGRTEADVRAFMQLFLDQQAVAPRWKWQLAITLPGDDRPIGSSGLRLDEPGSRVGNIGYELDPEHWGHGYATEAAREMVRFGFGDLGLHRIWSWCVADNGASARVLEKVGMRPEGRRREHEWYKGRWWDHLLCGLLEREWRDGAGADQRT